MSDELEYRSFPMAVDVSTDGESGKRLSGYAALVEEPYQVMDFEETLSRGAFRATLAKSPDVRLTIDHGGLPIARTTNKTLRLKEDVRGLRVDATLDLDRPAAREVAAAIKRGDVSEMSFAFRVPKGGDEWNDSRTKRTVSAIDLAGGDVSVVSAGANSKTVVAIRARHGAGRVYLPSSYLGLAKAKRAQAKARARISDSRARGRARRGSLVLSPFGEDWEVDTHTLHDRILQVEVGHARGPNEDAIKAWVWKRADELMQADRVPPAWKNPALLAAYIEEHPPATSSASVGGQGE